MQREATLDEDPLKPVYQGFLEDRNPSSRLPTLAWDLTDIAPGPYLRLRDSSNSAEPEAFFIIGPYTVVTFLQIGE